MKKILSILLAITMLLSSLAISTTALAEDSSVKVSYSVFDGGMFTMMPTEITVSADISNAYADQIGYNDTLDVPTVLDATIQAHIEMFGEDFMDYAPLMLTEQGWINGAFGEDSNAVGYRNNGVSCMSFDEALTDGGYVEFMFYCDTAYWSDTYNSFNTRFLEASTFEQVTLTMTADSWGYVTPAEDVTVLVNDEPVGVTNEKGEITFTPAKAGLNIVTALPDYENDEYFFAPYCEIFVASVDEMLENAVDFVIANQLHTELTASNAYYYQMLLEAGKDLSATNDAFVKNVIANLKNNKGKLVVGDNEDVGLYGSVICILDQLGYNASNFEGYNLIASLEAVDPKNCSNPYFYKNSIRVATPQYAKKLIDAYISEYYKLGSGMNYWGYNTDNTADFLTAIAKYKDDYAEYVNDAKALIEATLTDTGYYSCEMYGTTANADSTAKALMAYSALGETKKANEILSLLVNNFSGSKAGYLTYMGNDGDNAYATIDGIFAYEYYLGKASFSEYEHLQHPSTAKVVNFVAPTCTEKGHYDVVVSCAVCDIVLSTKTVELDMVEHNVVTDKAVKATYAKAGKTEGSHCKTCGKVIKAQKAVAKLTVAKPTNVKISALSKGFKLSWSKNSKATGYQIQYSTSSSYKNAKTITITNNSTTSKAVTKLTAKKKYYARVRAYKTENGKRYYSSWVAKTVTTKK